MAAVYAASITAIEAYHSDAVIDAGIHLVTSDGTHPVRGRMQANPASWRTRTRGAVAVSPVTGNHWDLMLPANVAALARAIESSLGIRPVGRTR
jgi:thioesterase domain-containing protein